MQFRGDATVDWHIYANSLPSVSLSPPPPPDLSLARSLFDNSHALIPRFARARIYALHTHSHAQIGKEAQEEEEIEKLKSARGRKLGERNIRRMQIGGIFAAFSASSSSLLLILGDCSRRDRGGRTSHLLRVFERASRSRFFPAQREQKCPFLPPPSPRRRFPREIVIPGAPLVASANLKFQRRENAGTG